MPGMRRPARSVLRIAAAASLPAAFAVGFACSGPPAIPVPGPSRVVASPEAGPPCPANLAAAVGAACATEGQLCLLDYACGIAPATARCTCAGGAFTCTDLEDASIATPAATPWCPPRADAEACPASERAASLAVCVETGLICTYLAPCDATPAFDQCQCAEGPLPSGATGLRFVCTSACTYLPDAAIPAESAASPAADGSVDASPAEASD